MRRYKRLDMNQSGDIDANELFPIIVELTDSEPWAVSWLVEREKKKEPFNRLCQSLSSRE